MTAPDVNRFPGTHQESITIAIALIDDNNARIIANMIEVDLFDPPFDDIVARCLEHRKQFNKPPGKGHIDDLFSHIFDDKDHKDYKYYDTLIGKMIEQCNNIDTYYVLSEVTNFIRLRKLRHTLAEGVERYQKAGEGVFEDIEIIARKMLKIRNEERDYGFTLAEDRSLGFMNRDSNDSCYIGIPALDERGIIPTKREMMGFLSPPNRGKSNFLIHCGKYAILKGWKTVHYTLENSDDMTAQRYFQTLFSGVRREGNYKYAAFDKDDLSKVITLRTEVLDPSFVIANQEDTIKFITDKIKSSWKDRLANLRIRRFPSGKLSFEMLEQDLDDLATIHKFVPDMILLDMPQLMKMPRRGNQEDWSSINELITNLRGLAVERNLAMVIPQQGNRSSNNTKTVQAQHGSGSFGIFSIADNLLTYSQTPSEEEKGLARLYTQKVRNDKARMTICISQHYDSGQFCMDSYPMTNQLRDVVREYTGYQEGETEGDDEFDTGKKRRA